MNEMLQGLKEKFDEAAASINDLQLIEKLRIDFLSKKGLITNAMSNLKDMIPEERKSFGAAVNDLKNYVEEKLSELKINITAKQYEAELSKTTKYDVTLPVNKTVGGLHPISIVQAEIEKTFKSMGFIVEYGNEIEDEFTNFESLNIPGHHPARDMQDTYYLENGQLMKTQTSASQNRIMRKYGTKENLENGTLKVIFPGRCFRNEATDAGHDNTFFQLEGMMIGKDISISNLIYFMKALLHEVFKRDVNVRLRPGYFPFVEPGFELDINCLICGGKGCSTCKNTGWLELLPCGMIHPNVLEMGGIDSEEYIGFAFGLGLTRLVMMKYGIKDIRVLNSGDLRVLNQFGTN